MDRKRVPGFLPRWPKGEDFEALYATYKELFPTSEGSIDQVSLMTVWLSLRLPFTMEDITLTSEQEE